MVLSPLELELFGEGAYQLNSSEALIVDAGTHIFKFPLWHSDFQAVRCIAALTRDKEFKHVIKPERCTIGVVSLFRYRRVFYNPLTDQEARSCLHDFYLKASQAIQQLHEELEVVHMDIHLENICFNEAFEAVLIDLERSDSVGTSSSFRYHGYYRSCMYNAQQSPEEHDWMQLGWLLAWVLCKG